MIERLKRPGLAALVRRLTCKRVLVTAYLLCALPVGLTFCLFTPAGAPTDESTHLARAAGLLHGAVLAQRKIGSKPSTGAPEWQTGVKEPAWLVPAVREIVVPDGHGGGVVPPGVFQGELTFRRAQFPGMVFINCPNTAMYFPALYIPASLGLGLGYLAGAMPHYCLVLARLFTFAAYLLMGALAIGITAFGEGVLIAVLLLPQTLFLASAVNQDGEIIAAMSLAAALLSRGAAHRRFWPALLIALVCAAKPPYLPFAALLLLPVRAPGLRRRLAAVAAVVLPVMLWAALITALVMVPFNAGRAGHPFYHPGPLADMDHAAWLNMDDPAANLRVLLADPARIVTLPLATMSQWGTDIITNLFEPVRTIGYHVRLDLGMAYDATAALVLALAVLGARLRAQRPLQEFGAADATLTLVCLAAAMWAVFLSLYLSYTQVGLASILGFNARYALPLFPFLIFLAPRFRRLPLPAGLSAWPALALGLFSAVYLPFIVATRFYAH